MAFEPYDYYGQFIAPLQKAQALRLQERELDMNEQLNRARIAEAERDAQMQQQFQQEAGAVISNPSPEGFRSLMLRYPKAHQALGEAWKQYSDGQQKRNSDAAASVYAALSNGRSDLALTILKQRKDALVKGGENTTETDAIIEAIESGDPEKIKQAKGLAGFVLAATAGPDKIGTTLEALGNVGKRKLREIDGILVDEETGEAVIQSPYSRIIAGPDGSFYEQPRVGTIPVIGGGGGRSEGGAVPGKSGGSPLDLGAISTLGGQFGTVTSTKRSPERNKKVGGAKNSYHLSGRAIDIDRAPGVTHNQIEQAYKQAGYQLVESLDEGDHSHFAFSVGPPRIKSKQQWEKLAKGTSYIAPDGTLRVK